ncbi:hypothetical protein ACFVFS_32600 [Kitasatospora sp. NPDC057692]|uniref:hypothetical protein n=1 Tax=Kitasatospora sp. NPDC057692 TaxID=3346215 RepID=UPI00367F82CC
MSAARLPAALAPWAGALSAITPELATALGPLLRRLDTLVGEREPVTDGPGEPDGVGGLGRTGRPDQLLPAEWLLAEDHPEEFLRRYLDRELLYLEPEFKSTAPRGRTVVMVDAGPSQAGAGRLVQLAALLVLHRRAAARGGELLVGVLGDEPVQWFGGEPADLLPVWLAARRSAEPVPEDVEFAAATLDAADRAWLLTAPRLADRLADRFPGRAAGSASGSASGLPRVLTGEPTRWGPAGATHVTVRLDRTAFELPLPAADIAVRALRGAEFRRAAPTAAARSAAAAPPGRGLPAFTTEAPFLLTRGRDAGTVVAVDVRDIERRHGSDVRPKAHRLHGRVIAAGRHGRRLIALHLAGGRVLRHVSGRPLAGPAALSVDPAELGLGEGLLERLAGRPVLPLLRTGDDLLVPVAGRWRRIAPDGTVTDDGPVGRGTERERGFDRFREPRLFARALPPAAARARHLVHADGTAAWSEDGKHWTVRTRTGDERRLSFRENAEVLGLVHDGREPALITWSPGGRLVRAVRADGVRTLSRFSGGDLAPAVHPTLPLIAAETSSGRIVVGDAANGRIHHMFGSDE